MQDRSAAWVSLPDIYLWMSVSIPALKETVNLSSKTLQVPGCYSCILPSVPSPPKAPASVHEARQSHQQVLSWRRSSLLYSSFVFIRFRIWHGKDTPSKATAIVAISMLQEPSLLLILSIPLPSAFGTKPSYTTQKTHNLSIFGD